MHTAMAGLSDLIDALRLDRARSSWSRSQTLEQCLTKLQGEIDECREALAQRNQPSLIEELGDALWSLIFSVIVAEEQCDLRFEDVTTAAYEKLRTRKPWLFEDGPSLTLEEEASRWAAAKNRERSQSDS